MADLDAELDTLEERARGRDFIVVVHGDLAIRLPRSPRARGKLVAERALREVLAPRFPTLVAPPVAHRLPEPLFAYRWTVGSPIGSARPSVAFLAELADFVGALHAMSDLPMTIDASPHTFVSRLQAIVAERFLPSLTAAQQARFAPAISRVLPTTEIVACPQHGDLSARNLLAGEDGRLVAVLDWSDSVIGDPAIDFGAIAQWAGMEVVDELLARTGRGSDRALRDRAEILGILLDAIDLAIDGRSPA